MALLMDNSGGDCHLSLMNNQVTLDLLPTTFSMMSLASLFLKLTVRVTQVFFIQARNPNLVNALLKYAAYVRQE